MEQILKTLGPTFLSLKEFGFAYGVQGVLLRRNLEELWLRQVVTQSKYNAFLLPSNTVIASMKCISEIGLDTVPFGIAEIDEVKNTWNQSLFPPKSKSLQHRIAKLTTVYKSDDAIGSVKDLFYKKQRERKSWWRKISENPKIYYMTETKKEKFKEYAEIQAQFPFGNIVIETISFKKSAKKLLPNCEDNNLRIVEHITSLDWGCLTLLCDGYIEIDESKELQIHPRLSPYKSYVKINTSPEDDESTREDLYDLSLYVIELLRDEGIPCVIMNKAKMPEVFQVPYFVAINSESLKSGLVKLVSQRTLCGETVHITDMAKLLFDLCVMGKIY